MDNLQSLLGIAALVLIAWMVGEGRGREPGRVLRIAGAGLAVQAVLAVMLLKLPPVKQLFVWLGGAVHALQDATRAGTGFVFGYLGGGTLPFAESHPGSSFVLAFQALPLVLVMSALSALLFHWRILPLIVRTIYIGVQVD